MAMFSATSVPATEIAGLPVTFPHVMYMFFSVNVKPAPTVANVEEDEQSMMVS